MTSPQVEPETIQKTTETPSRCATRGTTPALSRAVKSQYSEAEAAMELGITVEALRKMIRSHVVDRDEDLHNVPATSFQPSDLLILRLLAGMTPQS